MMRILILTVTMTLGAFGCSSACNLAKTLRSAAERSESIACRGQTVKVEESNVATSGDEVGGETYVVVIE